MGTEGLSYAAAGVDIEAYERALERVKPLIAATHGKDVAVGVGPFAGLYALPGGGVRQPLHQPTNCGDGGPGT